MPIFGQKETKIINKQDVILDGDILSNICRSALLPCPMHNTHKCPVLKLIPSNNCLDCEKEHWIEALNNEHTCVVVL